MTGRASRRSERRPAPTAESTAAFPPRPCRASDRAAPRANPVNPPPSTAAFRQRICADRAAVEVVGLVGPAVTEVRHGSLHRRKPHPLPRPLRPRMLGVLRSACPRRARQSDPRRQRCRSPLVLQLWPPSPARQLSGRCPRQRPLPLRSTCLTLDQPPLLHLHRPAERSAQGSTISIPVAPSPP